jgi:hypothetical protein
MHLHHKIAVIDGGTNNLSNLIPLCSICHTEWHTIEGFVNFEEFLEIPNIAELIALCKQDIEVVVGDQQMGIKDLIRTLRGALRPFEEIKDQDKRSSKIPASGD